MNLYQDDYPNWVDEFIEEVCNYLTISPKTEEEVWERVRQSEDIPHIGNEFCAMSFEHLIENLNKMFPNSEFSSYVNGMDTHFSVDDNSCNSFSDVIRITDTKTEV